MCRASRGATAIRQLVGHWAPWVEVGSALQHIRQHLRGHGVIRPRRARVLAVKPKVARAIPGNPFLQRAPREGARRW